MSTVSITLNSLLLLDRLYLILTGVMIVSLSSINTSPLFAMMSYISLGLVVVTTLIWDRRPFICCKLLHLQVLLVANLSVTHPLFLLLRLMCAICSHSRSLSDWLFGASLPFIFALSRLVSYRLCPLLAWSLSVV